MPVCVCVCVCVCVPSDFLKKKTCEVQAFLKAIQLYRQDKGSYEAWDMLIGSDVRVRTDTLLLYLYLNLLSFPDVSSLHLYISEPVFSYFYCVCRELGLSFD